MADVELDNEGRVRKLGMEVQTCALGQASAVLLAEQAIGRTAAEIDWVRNALAAYLEGSEPGPHFWPNLTIFEGARAHLGRHPAILLCYEAVSAAATQRS